MPSCNRPVAYIAAPQYHLGKMNAIGMFMAQPPSLSLLIAAGWVTLMEREFT